MGKRYLNNEDCGRAKCFSQVFYYSDSEKSLHIIDLTDALHFLFSQQTLIGPLNLCLVLCQMLEIQRIIKISFHPLRIL